MTPSNTRPCSLFLFDLDGTLIDSKADITSALNLVLARMKMPQLPESLVADFVGEGMQKLIERSLRASNSLGACPSNRRGRFYYSDRLLEPESNQVQQAMELFQEEYEIHLLDRTQLFPLVKEGLDRLPWARFAVVSNKPERFSRRILEGLGVGSRFRIILGGDSTQKRKPDPEALYMAMDSCKAAASETAMVGDSPVDIQAGKSAGVTTCGVLGGFRPQEELEAAGCDLIIRNLLELADHFHPPD
jgi:phosphoglycolate phosphatase